MYLVSACLAGIPCRYDGEDNAHPEIEQLVREGKALPVCPEQLGGLTTPRVCAERVGNHVINKEGRDVTEAFERGAQCCVALAKKYDCTQAILKAKSPSCGKGMIYDGTFTGVLIKGNGRTTELLEMYGIKVITENELSLLYHLDEECEI